MSNGFEEARSLLRSIASQPMVDRLAMDADAARHNIFAVEYSMARIDGHSPEKSAEIAMRNSGPAIGMMTKVHAKAIEEARKG